MTYAYILDTIREQIIQDKPNLCNNLTSEIISNFIHVTAKSCPESVAVANGWKEPSMVNTVFRAYHVLKHYNNLMDIDMQNMWLPCTSHACLIQDILGINLTSDMYFTICNGWGAFSLNPTEYRGTTVTALIKQAVLENKHEGTKRN